MIVDAVDRYVAPIRAGGGIYDQDARLLADYAAFAQDRGDLEHPLIDRLQDVLAKMGEAENLHVVEPGDILLHRDDELAAALGRFRGRNLFHRHGSDKQRHRAGEDVPMELW